MSSLLDRSARLAPATGAEGPSSLSAAGAAAIRAVGAGLVPVLVPVVLAWVLGAGGQVTWSQSVRFALALWLLAHHAGLAVDGGHVGLVPLGLLAVPLTACWFAGRRLARTLDPRAERIAAGATRAAPAALSRRALLAFVGAYCLVAGAASAVTGMAGLRPVSAQAVLGSAVVCLVGGGLGAAAYRCSGVRAGAIALLDRLPGRVRPWLRPAAAATVTWLGAGAVLVAVLLISQSSGVLALHRALDAGRVGGAILTVGELALIPNLVIWSSAALAGPGIALGSGATVTLGSSALGPLPAIPVLAALPAPGRMPALALGLLAVPVLAGATAGALVIRRGPDDRVSRLQQMAGAAAVCAVVATVLAWLSGGPAGPGRLADVGPSPLLTGLAFGGEVMLGAGLVVLGTAAAPRLIDWVRARRGP